MDLLIFNLGGYMEINRRDRDRWRRVADGEWRSFVPEGDRHLLEVFVRYQELISGVSYMHDHSNYEEKLLPYINFESQLLKMQQQIFKDFYAASERDGKELILEIGPNNKLSPLETAVFSDDRVVFAVDRAFGPKHRYTSRLSYKIAILAAERNSFAVFFQFDAGEIEPESLFDRVQIIFPNPEDQDTFCKEMAMFVKPGGELIVFVDPFLGGEPTEDDIVAQLPQDFSSEIGDYTREELEKIFGITDSHYLHQDFTPVVRARRLG